MTLVRFNNRFDSHANMFNGFNSESLSQNEPSANILESDSSFLIEMAVPGYSKKDISIALENHVLTVSHTDSEDKKSDSYRFARREFTYGDFRRSFRLSRWVDSESIKASFKNGILEIAIPKKAEIISKPSRVIEIS